MSKSESEAASGSMRLIGAAELAYLRANSVRETDVLRRLRAETRKLGDGDISAPPEVSQFLALLARATGARRAVEVGVFTGLTTLAMALAMPSDGRIVACDLPSAQATLSLARRHWREAGVEDRIDLRLGSARETLQDLLDGGDAGTIDLMFVDADKENYDTYYEQALVLLRPNGIVAFDNMLWYGAVAEESDRSQSTRALRALNAKLHGDARVALSMLPLGDGVTLACKRA